MSITISMPQLGETVTEGTILAWVKEVGDYVAEDDILVEISTDKVDTEIPSPSHGTLTEILVAAGTTVDVGTAICVLAEEGEEEQEAVVTGQDREPEPATSETTASDPAPPESRERRGVISPVVRKLAGEHNIDLAMVPGTGDGGRITRKDVEAFTKSHESPEPALVASAPAQEAPPATREPASGEVQTIPRIRAVIAENMMVARQSAAHVWTSVEVDYERVAQARVASKDVFRAAEGFSLSYLPFIVRATMEALSAYPVVNSVFDLEGGSHTFHKEVDLGLAIDLDQKGLVVANIPGMDSKTLRAVARSISSTATAARNGELAPDDFHGYTFSITNPGPFGSFMSAPIIPPPNAAILSTDTIVKRPVVIEMPDGSDGIAIHHIGYLGLSWDHRVFDGSTAVLFLNRIKENLETWDWEQELK
jgi:2-oxoglutarate dehydrogenase E2 component (dihydrolipoamide succinyltransferase)